MNVVSDPVWSVAPDGRPCVRLRDAADLARARRALDARVPGAPDAPVPPGTDVLLDGRALSAWDAALAAQVFALVEDLRGRGLGADLSALPEGLRGLLQLTGRPDSAAAAAAAPPLPTVPPAGSARWPGVRTLALVGGVLLAAARWLRGRAMPLGRDVLRQLDEAGPGALAIVVLTCGLIGLMLAYMGGAQLERMGAQGFLADVVTVGMVRELAGLMTGIVLAGRVASAFAAQLASMQAGEEIDALVVLGVDPVEHLVLPRLAALLLAAPALLAFGALAGVLAGWPAAVLSYGLSSAEYFAQCTRALTFTHLWIGLFKGVVYAGLVGLAGCREGLYAGRSAQDMGRAATAAVVRALVWVIGAACLSTVVFTSLGY
ncbi:MAG TPA: ABC transporter permease [Quisquiliibacterium sp.]|nr:ABC transporter permease [Quisquiliibacterium sp.]HQD82220.1 ABC transporter permease [Quisquiliibacterium sp.]HQN10698.1 ABC transporter permease [Quisquiliibacterium sp.]